jgi:hypothetical protein
MSNYQVIHTSGSAMSKALPKSEAQAICDKLNKESTDVFGYYLLRKI